MTLTAIDTGVQRDGRWLLQPTSIAARPGQVHAILGPNGAGKSTLLRLLSGDLRPDTGTVRYGARALQDWDSRQLAQLRAVLPQQPQLTFGFTAEDVVRLGRMPYRAHSRADEAAIVTAAMTLTGVDALRHRSYPTLSGGERTRVQLARVLSQIWEPVGLGAQTLLLDEPTANLDLAHQHRCLQLARQFAARGVAVIVVVHDPNLVFAYADEVTLLEAGQVIAQGTANDVLTAAALSKLYKVPVEVGDWRGHRLAQVISDQAGT